MAPPDMYFAKPLEWTNCYGQHPFNENLLVHDRRSEQEYSPLGRTCFCCPSVHDLLRFHKRVTVGNRCSSSGSPHRDTSVFYKLKS